MKLETVTKKLTQTQKYVHFKKTTILLQIGWYSGTFTYSWASYFDQVSQLQDKNCGFFIMNIFLSLGQFFRDSLYFLSVWVFLHVRNDYKWSLFYSILGSSTSPATAAATTVSTTSPTPATSLWLRQHNWHIPRPRFGQLLIFLPAAPFARPPKKNSR